MQRRFGGRAVYEMGEGKVITCVMAMLQQLRLGLQQSRRTIVALSAGRCVSQQHTRDSTHRIHSGAPTPSQPCS